MKIGFFGNTNNYPFTLAMLLRELGHSVFCVITEKLLLHRPESRYPELQSAYPDWILDISHLNEWDFISLNPELAVVLERLSQCDVLVLNGLGPSFLPFLNKPAIALLTGSDLSHYANLSSVEIRMATASPQYKETPEGQDILDTLQDFIQRQRMGILNAVAVRYFPRGSLPEDDRLLDEIGVPDSRRYFFPLSNVDRLEYSPTPHNVPLRVFCGARLTWKRDSAHSGVIADYKGSDIMIRGLGLFYRETGIRLDIHLVRKGLDIRETEELIEQEGITDQITWHEVMSLVDYWREIEKSDIIFDQLAEAIPGAPVLDAMAIGRPVIANTRPEVFGMFEDHFPLYIAKSVEDVCANLKKLALYPEAREQAGREGRRYIEKNFGSFQTIHQMEGILKDALATATGQNGVFGLNYIYILETLFHVRSENVRKLNKNIEEINRTQQENNQLTDALESTRKQFETTRTQLEHNIETTRTQLEQTREDLANTRYYLNQYERFYKMFRPLVNKARKIPYIRRYVQDFPV